MPAAYDEDSNHCSLDWYKDATERIRQKANSGMQIKFHSESRVLRILCSHDKLSPVPLSAAHSDI